MTQYYGDFPEDATVRIPVNTFSSDDPSASVTITNLADADIKVHKDGSTTEIATDGATVAIDFDGVTGNHLVTIDTSAHADYSTGSDYFVRMEGTTVDGATINAWIGCFSIENRYMRGTNSASTHSAADVWIAGTRTLTANTNLNDPTADTIADAVLDEALSGHAAAGSLGKAITDIEADTNELQGNQGNWLTATGFSTHSAADVWTVTTRVLTAGTNLNDLSAAQVKTQAADALSDLHLDQLFAANYDPASKPGVATAFLNELVESDGGVTRFTANALEEGPSGGGGGGGGDATEAKQDMILGNISKIPINGW